MLNEHEMNDFLLAPVSWIILDKHMRIAEFTGSPLTVMSLIINRALYAHQQKYGVCQGKGGLYRTPAETFDPNSRVLTRIAGDKSGSHAAVKRPCYTFVAEIFNEKWSISGVNNFCLVKYFYRTKQKISCVLSTRKYVARTFHYWNR